MYHGGLSTLKSMMISADRGKLGQKFTALPLKERHHSLEAITLTKSVPA
jgi:hypothetical protein